MFAEGILCRHNWVRTSDLPIISRTLYQLSYASIWSTWWDSNPRINGFAIRAIKPLWYMRITWLVR